MTIFSPSSTTVDQSAPNLDLIGQELSELCALEFAIFDFVYTLASANIDQSVPNLANIYAHQVSEEIDYGTY